MFAFAGLWDRWTDPQGKEIASCTIITTTPNSHLADIHDRMPVILPSAAYASWLTPAMRDSSVALTGSLALCRCHATIPGEHEGQSGRER